MDKKRNAPLQIGLALVSLIVVVGYGFLYVNVPEISNFPYNIIGLAVIAAVFSVLGMYVRAKIDKTAKYYMLTMYAGLVLILAVGIIRAIFFK